MRLWLMAWFYHAMMSKATADSAELKTPKRGPSKSEVLRIAALPTLPRPLEAGHMVDFVDVTWESLGFICLRLEVGSSWHLSSFAGDKENPASSS